MFSQLFDCPRVGGGMSASGSSTEGVPLGLCGDVHTPPGHPPDKQTPMDTPQHGQQASGMHPT